MTRRMQLHRILSDIPGVTKAYFQPPATVKMSHPCIVYELNNMDTQYADDNPYAIHKGYTVTVIDANPDSEIPNHVSKLQYCRFDRYFSVDNLNHYIFKLYY